MCAPKGSGFLYARPDAQHLLEPLVVGWGWGTHRTTTFGSDFIDYQQWLGTNDVSAYLAVPDAIQFQRDHNWAQVQADCHALALQTAAAITDFTGLPPLTPFNNQFFQQMVALPLPAVDPADLKARLLNDFRIEIPITEHNGRALIRLSVQAYNTPDDTAALLHALRRLT